MKIYTLLALLLATASQAALIGTPYTPEEDKRFDLIERTGAGFAAGAIPTSALAGSITEAKQIAFADNSLNVARIAKDTYDFAVNGGAISAIPLHVTLPAKAVVVRSWIHIVSAVTGTSGATLAFSCKNANDLFTATDETASSSDTFVTGASDYTVANFKSMSTSCTITATIAVHVLTAGKVTVYAEYFVKD